METLNEIRSALEADSIEDPMEALLQKHKKEKKELQGVIQGLKKTVTKGDKKKKKQIQDEISKLETDLSKKQNDEIEKLKENLKNDINESKDSNKVVETEKNVEQGSTKVSKAQKRRDKKAAEQREREKRIQEQEAENEFGSRNVEMNNIAEKLKKMNLMVYHIEPDGNCLYNAIDHQLKGMYGVQKLRFETGTHIKENSTDYLPFLSNPNTGEMLTEQEFVDYCNNIINTTNWGGQVELKALSKVIRKPITVIQAEGPPLVMGEEYINDEGVIITYHRHMYKLGEHYNSVQPFVEDSPT